MKPFPRSFPPNDPELIQLIASLVLPAGNVLTLGGQALTLTGQSLTL